MPISSPDMFGFILQARFKIAELNNLKYINLYMAVQD